MHDQISVPDQPSNRAVAFSVSANSYTIVQFFSVIHIQPHEHDLLPACKAGEEALGISAVFHEACTLIQAYCRPVFCHNFQFQLDISRFFCAFDAGLCQRPSDAVPFRSLQILPFFSVTVLLYSIFCHPFSLPSNPLQKEAAPIDKTGSFIPAGSAPRCRIRSPATAGFRPSTLRV